MNNLFDLSQEYDSMLNEGLKISGEEKEYFIRGRVEDLLRNLPQHLSIKKILDFGCGVGDATMILKEYFKDSEVTGTDLSNEALKYAEEKYSDPSVKFIHLSEIPVDYFDLVYVNGVFHHIEPHNRIEALKKILASLKTNGVFSFFENNPWNVGTKIIMKRIPFDKDAQTINPLKANKLLKLAGFKKILSTRYLFYFPKMLSFLRFTEKFLVKIPFGAQYLIISQK
ncbi:MAG: class I SAM-dependent methyltransferase [Bacteroidota bacterium]|nr:class I SAM-dependent methyltransferase [Bacteroidota bacterium]